MATANQVAINPVKLAGVTYDTLGIVGISCTLKGIGKTRVDIRLDGDMPIIPNTDVLSFGYAIAAGSRGVQNPNNTPIRNVINLSGDKLPETISYSNLIKLALEDANTDSDVKFSLV